MPNSPNLAVAAAVAAVAVALALGVLNMLRQGSSNRSQNLMRWRVGLQFVAIVVIVLVLLLRHH